VFTTSNAGTFAFYANMQNAVYSSSEASDTKIMLFNDELNDIISNSDYVRYASFVYVTAASFVNFNYTSSSNKTLVSLSSGHASVNLANYSSGMLYRAFPALNVNFPTATSEVAQPYLFVNNGVSFDKLTISYIMCTCYAYYNQSNLNTSDVKYQ
jgi:hypothetical protein